MNFLLLYLFSILTRLPFLIFGFPSITHDEADIFINSFLVSKTGSDILNQGFFMTSGALSANSPFAIYYLSLFFLFLPKTIFFARLALLLLNSLIPVLVYLVTNKLTKNKLISLFSYLSLNFSPWLMYISSQSGFNAPLSLTFYLLSITSLLYIKKLIKKYLLFFLFLFLSFNAYLGFASVFPIFVFIALIIDKIYNQKIEKNFNIKKIVLYIFISLLTYGLFTFIVLKLPGNEIFKSTQTKILTINKDLLLNKIWYENHISSNNLIANKILNNKITVIFNNLIDRYFNAFNPSLLFIKGDPHAIYGTNRFGLFYLFEIIFIFIGLIKFLNVIKNKSILLFFILLGLLIASPLSIILQPEITLTFRSITMVFPLSIIIGIGIYYFVKQFKLNKNIILLLYFIGYLSFFIVFNFKTKIISSEHWHLSEKQLFDKIETLERNKKVIILNQDKEATFLLYSFYKIDDAKIIKEKWQIKDYSFSNIFFTNECPLKIPTNTIYLLKRDVCKKEIYSLIPYNYANDKSGVMYYKIESIK